MRSWKQQYNRGKWGLWIFAFTLMAVFSSEEVSGAPQMGVVNFQKCVANSKMGKQEQISFEGMRSQMSSILEEKEKALNELQAKFKNPDYLDGLAPEAEAELQRKYQTLHEELMQLRNQYMQTLQQANIRIIQNLNKSISDVSKLVAQDKKLDIVVNAETCFYCSENLDISDLIIAKMDETIESEQNAPERTNP